MFVVVTAIASASVVERPCSWCPRKKRLTMGFVIVAMVEVQRDAVDGMDR